ncbi:glycoside hydrolase family 66 protein [Pontibacter beigongshangensis]|uniref:glycoside hydrolase family 66 protein n=1 Tax=Pontibacter beigongshangensis TaxID=2574733 RepID=UPI00164EE73D|nr:glycoside hydrolase family 66 protein [Pontibacter beigongshangensis]
MLSMVICLVTVFAFSESARAAARAKPVRQIASGEWIKSISKDKAAYSPGAVVDFTLALEQSVTGLSLQVSYYHLSTVVTQQAVVVSGNTVNWSWVTPNADFNGYMVKAELRNGSTVLDEVTIAVDVSSDWTKFPRYGFLSKYRQDITDTTFAPISDWGMDTVINKLTRFHINGLQFYDWMDTHHDPLAGTASNPASEWDELSGKRAYLSTVKGYIDRAHNKNMKAMFYNLVYGAYPNAPGVNKEWGLFWNQDGTNQWSHCCFHHSWETQNLPVYDPGNANWRNFIINAHNEVYDAAGLSFDGYHADQLGKFGPLYKYNSFIETHPNQSFGTFLTESKNARPNKYLVMNAVDQYGQENITQAPVSFTYSELWGAHEGYYDLGKAIQTNIELKNTNTVLAAYVNKDKSENTGIFNDASVLMADAVIFAFGGAHIELGEHMLANPYFPNNNLKMSAQLENDLLTYYDFAVAYENILRDGRTFNNVTLSGAGSSVNSVTYWREDQHEMQGKVATVGVQWGNNQAFHLLNFSNANHMNWRDNAQSQPVPITISDLSLQFSYTTPITRMWVASPDFNNGLPQLLTSSQYSQANGVVTVNLPQLKYWTMLVAETGSSVATVAAPAFSTDGGTYTAAPTVTIASATPDAIIRYTLDGTTPTSISPQYTGPITISNSCTLNAYASKAGLADSPVSTAAYTISIPAGGIVSGGIYQISARHSGKVLEIAGGETATTNGAMAQQWQYTGGANQKWKIEDAGNGYYRIFATHSLKALDVAGGSTAEGADLHQWEPLTTESQEWSLFDVGSDYLKIENRKSSSVLDVYGAATTDGTAVKQYLYTGVQHQQWSLQLLSNAMETAAIPIISSVDASVTYTGPVAVTITSATSGATIHYTTDGSTPTTASAVYTGPVTVSNTCTLKAVAFKPGMINSSVATTAYSISAPAGVVAGGVYKITAKHSGKALDVKQQLTTDGTIIYQYEYLGAANQKWLLEGPGNGYFKLIATHSSKAMDVVGGSTAEGVAIHQWTPVNTTSQDWSIIDAGDGNFKIENRKSGKVLDVYGASTANEAAVNQYFYTAAAHQQFAIEPVSQNREAVPATVEAEQQLTQIYPNPAHGSVKISLNSKLSSTAEVTIYNAVGKLVYKASAEAGATLDISTGKWQGGLYLVHVNNGTEATIQKLIIR